MLIQLHRAAKTPITAFGVLLIAFSALAQVHACDCGPSCAHAAAVANPVANPAPDETTEDSSGCCPSSEAPEESAPAESSQDAEPHDGCSCETEIGASDEDRPMAVIPPADGKQFRQLERLVAATPASSIVEIKEENAIYRSQPTRGAPSSAPALFLLHSSLII